MFFNRVVYSNTEKSVLEVYDLLGAKVTSIPIENKIGLKTISLDLAKMASAEYILVFKNGNNRLEKKIIKL
ncbi:MAG: T9SS type A sorting domain-containing protein [Polaribacter sp.]|nr:T9SS type A sorting domain-containing protein [Polaribacter sp.]